MRPGATSIRALLLIACLLICYHERAFGQTGKDSVLVIRRTDDFSLDGRGASAHWSKAEWIDLNPTSDAEERNEGLPTRAKVLYSSTGVYFLFECEDKTLQATLDEDFTRLWTEDVVEVFLWPDEEVTSYFEYELSPLNYELILRIARDERGRSSWRPFSYGEGRRTRHMTAVEGGMKESGSAVTQWTAEFFIPYKLLHPARNIPPTSGTRWRANLYRIDYDEGQTLIAWQPIHRSFHEYERFGTFVFE